MVTRRLEGRFTVKEGAAGEVSLMYESGPGPMIILELKSDATLEGAQELARHMNRGIVALVVDQIQP